MTHHSLRQHLRCGMWRRGGRATHGRCRPRGGRGGWARVGRMSVAVAVVFLLVGAVCSLPGVVAARGGIVRVAAVEVSDPVPTPPPSPPGGLPAGAVVGGDSGYPMGAGGSPPGLPSPAYAEPSVPAPGLAEPAEPSAPPAMGPWPAVPIPADLPPAATPPAIPTSPAEPTPQVLPVPKLLKIWLTGYSWQDNTPPGSSTVSHPVLHRKAGGSGTYDDPITVAVPGKGAGIWKAGGRFYLPTVTRYVIVEDTGASQPHSGEDGHLDMWIGGQDGTRAATDACMDTITGEQVPALHNPPPGLPVIPGPIFAGGTCNVAHSPTPATLDPVRQTR